MWIWLILQYLNSCPIEVMDGWMGMGGGGGGVILKEIWMWTRKEDGFTVCVLMRRHKAHFNVLILFNNKKQAIQPINIFLSKVSGIWNKIVHQVYIQWCLTNKTQRHRQMTNKTQRHRQRHTSKQLNGL